MQIWCSLVAIAALAVSTTSCSRGPGRVKPPYINPESAAGKSIELYDTNKDENLDDLELTKCPAMLATKKAYDTDGNGRISRDEIAARISEIRKNGVGLTFLTCNVKLNGQSLENATIDFEPEPYLGDQIKSAHGVTDKTGMAHMAIRAEELPSDQQDLKAIHYGTYKVKITHPKKSLSAKYNSETTLGYETRVGDPYAAFNLKTP
jgi:hypothetical protein